MNGFTEPYPDIVQPQPGGPDDPLCESVLDPAAPWLRIHEPRDVRLVIGRGQDPRRELHHEVARADGVAIHRRVSGGGAVVLAPGMVIIAVRLRNTLFGTACWFDLVNQALAPALGRLCGILPSCRGHGDLALLGGDGQPRKILGASLRQTARTVYYLGVLLVADQQRLMERYLRPPSREPEYRLGRGHADFCTHLGRFGVGVPAVRAAVLQACLEHLRAHAGE